MNRLKMLIAGANILAIIATIVIIVMTITTSFTVKTDEGFIALQTICLYQVVIIFAISIVNLIAITVSNFLDKQMATSNKLITTLIIVSGLVGSVVWSYLSISWLVKVVQLGRLANVDQLPSVIITKFNINIISFELIGLIYIGVIGYRAIKSIPDNQEK